MDGATLALIELVLVAGIVLGFAVWELIALRRDSRGDDRDPRR